MVNENIRKGIAMLYGANNHNGVLIVLCFWQWQTNILIGKSNEWQDLTLSLLPLGIIYTCIVNDVVRNRHINWSKMTASTQAVLCDKTTQFYKNSIVVFCEGKSRISAKNYLLISLPSISVFF